MNCLLSLDQDEGRRVWVILDELPTLHQVPSLQSGLAESRQFGGCFVLGVQVASALRDLYGRNGAETISGLCGTRVVFAAPDRDTAQWSADSLGRSEIEEVSEGVSYGADPYRDGVTLTPRRELQSLALPSEIMRLPNLTGYLKLPGPYPVARIELQYVKRPRIAPRFVPRREDHRVENRTEAVADDHSPEQETTLPGPVAEPVGESAAETAEAQCELALDFEREDEGKVETRGPDRPEDDPGSVEAPAPQEDHPRRVREAEIGPPAEEESAETDGFRI